MPICPNCGTKNAAGRTHCEFCSAPIESGDRKISEPGASSPLNLSEAFAQSSTNAKITLVTGLLSLVMCGFLLGITAIVIGSMELSKITAGLSPAPGRRLIQIGMTTGVIGIILQIFWMVLGVGSSFFRW